MCRASSCLASEISQNFAWPDFFSFGPLDSRDLASHASLLLAKGHKNKATIVSRTHNPQCLYSVYALELAARLPRWGLR